METLPSCTLLEMVTKRWLNYYCLLEQTLISNPMFVIVMMTNVLFCFVFLMNNVLSFCSDCSSVLVLFSFK